MRQTLPLSHEQNDKMEGLLIAFHIHPTRFPLWAQPFGELETSKNIMAAFSIWTWLFLAFLSMISATPTLLSIPPQTQSLYAVPEYNPLPQPLPKHRLTQASQQYNYITKRLHTHNLPYAQSQAFSSQANLQLKPPIPFSKHHLPPTQTSHHPEPPTNPPVPTPDVPNTATTLEIWTGIPTSGPKLRLTLQFIRIQLSSLIASTSGDTPIKPDPFEYPSNPSKAVASTGLALRVYTRSLGRAMGGLRWRQVDDAMRGLQVKLWGEGVWREAHFVIYDTGSGVEVC